VKLSIIMPNFNGERFLEAAMRSVVSQRDSGLELEYIVVDGGSTDRSLDLIRSFGSAVNRLIVEKDTGPANAINKGLAAATGDVLAWLNSDDFYQPGALARVADFMASRPGLALCFGHCPIFDENGREIRIGITRFKEMFFPFSCRFMIQCINYISQPAMFFRRSAFEKAGPLREDWKCAWDYDFILRLWKQGGASAVPNPPLAGFRWHESSLSGQHFDQQFREEWTAAVSDAGRFSPQAGIHLGVRWGIVWSYRAMARRRRQQNENRN
jgi:glycosyltransferase involved in cell wall biosynthesis